MPPMLGCMYVLEKNACWPNARGDIAGSPGDGAGANPGRGGTWIVGKLPVDNCSGRVEDVEPSTSTSGLAEGLTGDKEDAERGGSDEVGDVDGGVC